MSTLTLDQPVGQPNSLDRPAVHRKAPETKDPWTALTEELQARSQRLRCPCNRPLESTTTARRLLAAMAETAGAMANILDTLRTSEFPDVEDVETAAELRVQLDQAAAAAADLHHTLCCSGLVAGPAAASSLMDS